LGTNNFSSQQMLLNQKAGSDQSQELSDGLCLLRLEKKKK
jgi:hypothetical protein